MHIFNPEKGGGVRHAVLVLKVRLQQVPEKDEAFARLLFSSLEDVRLDLWYCCRDSSAVAEAQAVATAASSGLLAEPWLPEKLKQTIHSAINYHPGHGKSRKKEDGLYKEPLSHVYKPHSFDSAPFIQARTLHCIVPTVMMPLFCCFSELFGSNRLHRIEHSMVAP